MLMIFIDSMHDVKVDHKHEKGASKLTRALWLIVEAPRNPEVRLDN